VFVWLDFGRLGGGVAWGGGGVDVTAGSPRAKIPDFGSF